MELSEDTIRKRLSALNTSQDSIQTASLWILHYKDAVGKVAKCWMDVYQNADDKLRVALIYVMNDVVQTAGKKDKSDIVKMAFHPHMVNACGLANDNVKKAIIRCVDVFAQRHVFPSHIVEEMRAALGVTKKGKASANFDDNLSEVDYTAMIRSIESYSQDEEITEKARNILAHSNFNFKDKMQERMKDRKEGTKIMKEMDESKHKLVQFLNSVERHQNKCKRLMEMLRTAKSSLNVQLRDVTIVDDAYEKFERGIQETRKQLNAKINSGDLVSNRSPPHDAPSPLPTDDPFNVEGGSGDDMDIADDEGTSSALLPAATNSNKSPSKSTLKPQHVASSSSSALDPRLQRLINHQQAARQAVPREVSIAMGGSAATSTPTPAAVDPRRRSRTSLDESTNGNHAQPSQQNAWTPGSSPSTPKISRMAPPNASQPYSPSMGPLNVASPTGAPPFFNTAPPGVRGPVPAASPHVQPPPHFPYPPQNPSPIMSYLPPPNMLPPPHLGGYAQGPPPRFTRMPPPVGGYGQPPPALNINDAANAMLFGTSPSMASPTGSDDSHQVDPMDGVRALEYLKQSGIPLQNTISPYLQVDPSIFKNSEPQYIMPEDNGRLLGLSLGHVGMAVGAGFGVGCARGFIGELFNPDTRKLAMRPWFTRVLNATAKHGSGYAQPAGATVFLYCTTESVLKYARADDPLNSFVASALTGALYRSPHGRRAMAIGSVTGLALATLWNIGNPENRQQLRDMFNQLY